VRGDDDGGTGLAAALQQPDDKVRVAAVEARGRFVGEQEYRPGHQCPCNCEAALLSARQLVRICARPLSESDVVEPELGAGTDLASGQPEVGNLQCERQVATRAHVLEEPVILKDSCHTAPEARQKAAPPAFEPEAVHADGARAGPQVAMNELEEGGLAGFAGAGYENELAGGDGQADFFDGDQAPIATADPRQPDERGFLLGRL